MEAECFFEATAVKATIKDAWWHEEMCTTKHGLEHYWQGYLRHVAD